MREVSTDYMMNMDMVLERIRPQLDVTRRISSQSLSWDCIIIVIL